MLLVFLRAACLSVNGGTTLALLEEDLVDRLHRLTPEQFTTGVAVGSSTPGPLGYGAIALGFLAYGWPGALVATFTSWLPAFLVIPLRAGYQKLEQRPWLRGLSWGVASAGTGLLLALVFGLLPHALHGWREAVVALAALVLLFRGLPAPAVIALAAVAGVLLF